MRKLKCYIAGKIGDLPEEEYKGKFNIAKNELKRLGYEPISPVDLPHEHDRTWQSYMREDIQALVNCDAVFMLNNWQDSEGAKTEHEVAKQIYIPIIYQK